MNEDKETEKLHKVLAKAGLGSRREMEQLIERGDVKINGELATIGLRITKTDKIKVQGKIIINPMLKGIRSRVIVYHKPVGEICTREDNEGRKTVFTTLPQLKNSRWVMVGRLDINTSGLLLFTTDGELANGLMHPRFAIEREYAVRVIGDVNKEKINTLLGGVKLEDGMAKFDKLFFKGGQGKNAWYHVILHEGRNREVRRLFESQNITVSRLIRIRYGEVSLPRSLRRGDFMELNNKAIESLLASVGTGQ